MKLPHTDAEKNILMAFSFDLEVTLSGKKRVSQLAQRLIAAVYTEAESNDPLAYCDHGSDDLRRRLCRFIPKSRKREVLKPAIEEAIDHGLLHKRRPYETSKCCYGYAVSNCFLKGSKVWTINPKLPDVRNYPPVATKFDWLDNEWDMSWLNHLSLDESVVELLETHKSNPQRLNRLAYDVSRILKRKYRITVGNTWRITMLTNQICSDLRCYLTHKGKRLVEGDIKTCHPTLLAWLYRKIESPAAKTERTSFIQYTNDCEFYSMFMDEGNEDAAHRDQAKKRFNAWLNGAENRVIYETLHSRFPLLANLIKSVNSKEKAAFKKREEEFRIKQKLSRTKAHRRYKEDGMTRVVGCAIQKLEAKIVCRKCFKYALENGKVFLPIHDGFQCLPEDYELFSKMIVDGFKEEADVTVRVEPTTDSKNFMQSMKASQNNNNNNNN